MIIKKKKIKDNEEQNQDESQEIESNDSKNDSDDFLFNAFQNITERSERRRGDRRRGYRRVDDRNLISRAQEESHTIREESAKEGFQYGLQEAKSEILNLKEAIATLLKAKDNAFAKYQDDIAFIAIKVAEKIIRTEVACDETIVLSIVSEVLKDVGKDENRIIIKANPLDSQLLRSKLPELFPFADSKVKILVEEDNLVEVGSCIVLTNSGQIDAKFSTQIEIMQKAFEADL